MHCILTLLLIIVTIFAQAQDASGLLEKSRKHVKAQQSISYKYNAYWPNPVGEIDTVSGECMFVVGKQASFPYDFVAKANGWDMMYIDGDFQQVSHADKKVELHPDREQAVRMFTGGMIPIKYGPLMLLAEKNWRYVRDTTIVQPLAGFRMVERDTVINGNRILVMRWLYIGKKSMLPEWYVQEAFKNGKSSQRIEFEFIDYKLSKTAAPLVYTLPVGYTSKVFGTNKGPQVLLAGTEAPVFQVTDLQGKPVDLKALRGKKVLLNFSVINCGYCKLAIDHMNGAGFALPKDVIGLYVNPIDKADRVASYAQKSHIPFQVVADARVVGAMYGVSGYPTFFLIDEKGVIQETVVGYRKEFLDGLGKLE